MRRWVCRNTSTASGSARSGDRASRTGGGRPTAEFANTSVDADRYPRKGEVVTRVILRPPSSGPYLGAPEAMQAAVAAGLCGLGTVFVGSIEGCAKMLYEAMPKPDASLDLSAVAHATVERFRAAKRIIPGIGHPFHKPVDPRAPRLFAVAEETGFSGPYLRLVTEIGREAENVSGKVLPVNATGAIGALCCEMGFDWTICRGLGVMARAVGLVGHILEESRQPMAEEVWHMVEQQATEHFHVSGQPKPQAPTKG